MINYLIIIFFVFGFSVLKSQDSLFFKSGKILPVKIIEVNNKKIVYKESFVFINEISIQEIQAIKYLQTKFDSINNSSSLSKIIMEQNLSNSIAQIRSDLRMKLSNQNVTHIRSVFEKDDDGKNVMMSEVRAVGENRTRFIVCLGFSVPFIIGGIAFSTGGTAYAPQAVTFLAAGTILLACSLHSYNNKKRHRKLALNLIS